MNAKKATRDLELLKKMLALLPAGVRERVTGLWAGRRFFSYCCLGPTPISNPSEYLI